MNGDMSCDMNGNMSWQFRYFNDLSLHELHALMQLRVDVFVVEQKCAYRELDEFDTRADTEHLLGCDRTRLAAYARAYPSGDEQQPTVTLGRVVVAPDYRGRGIATTLMQTLMRRVQQQYPNRPLLLAAQVSVQALYRELGFTPVSTPYLEDDIEHIDMRLPA